MPTAPFHLDVELPSHDQFTASFPQYGRFAREEGGFLFDLVMTPESFVAARVVTLALGLPGVAGVTKAAKEAVNGQTAVEWRGFTKQYIGALVCSLMEANGFEKTGEKRAVTVPGFTKGEYYRLRNTE